MNGFGESNLYSPFGKVVANDAARQAAVPTSAGEQLFQTDIGAMYVGRSAVAGDWFPAGCLPVILDTAVSATSSTTLTSVAMTAAKNPSGLAFFGVPIAANEEMMLHGKFLFREENGWTNMKLKLSGPGTSATAEVFWEVNASGAVDHHKTSMNGIVNASLAALTSNVILVTMSAVIQNAATAGNVILQIAQATSNAIPLTLQVGATLTAIRNRP